MPRPRRAHDRQRDEAPRRERRRRRPRPTTEGNLGDGLFPLPAFPDAGGAQALGRPVGALAPGSRADRSGDTLPESWIFSGNANPVRDVIVGGQMVVRQGVHPHEEQALADYRRAVAAQRVARDAL